MSIPTSALVECPNNAILYVMVLDDVEFVEIPSYSILTVKNEIMYKYRLFFLRSIAHVLHKFT